MPSHVGAIDQGTTSTRFVVVDHAGRIVAMEQCEHRQLYPRPGWVEHDAGEIWRNTERVIAGALDRAGIAAADLAAVGVTNQRESVLLWDRASGEPLTPVVVWQDTRTDALCRKLGADGGPDRFRARTGLPIATYFSGPKLRWLLDDDAGLAAKAASGAVCAGTMDSWVLHKLTGLHVTDVTNASRTLLMSLDGLAWDGELLEAMSIPERILPEIRPSIGDFGRARGPLDGVPVAAVLGDQQSAVVGHGLLDGGGAKVTYGTGCFLLQSTGARIVHSRNGLLTTVAYQAAGEAPRYALEGSVAIAGAGIQWLRDNLGLIRSAAEVEELARSVPDNGGVYFVPAFSGLFAPHWRPDARGIVGGLTRHARSGHIARAMLEAVAFQNRDVLEAMAQDTGARPAELRVDGGMVRNELLMQFQADLLELPIVIPENTETTVMGAAYAAGLAVGFWSDIEEIRSGLEIHRRIEPAMEPGVRQALCASWALALEKSLGWAGGS